MSLLQGLCRRVGRHRRFYLSVEGGRSAEHDINQIVLLFLNSLLIRVPLWKPNDLCIRSIKLSHPLTSVRPLDLNTRVNVHASCRSGVPLYGGAAASEPQEGR